MPLATLQDNSCAADAAGGVPCALILAMCSRIFATSRSSVHAAMRFSRIAGPRFLRICTPSENVSRRELRVLYLRARAHASRALCKARWEGRMRMGHSGAGGAAEALEVLEGVLLAHRLDLLPEPVS